MGSPCPSRPRPSSNDVGAQSLSGRTTPTRSSRAGVKAAPAQQDASSFGSLGSGWPGRWRDLLGVWDADTTGWGGGRGRGQRPCGRGPAAGASSRVAGDRGVRHAPAPSGGRVADGTSSDGGARRGGGMRAAASRGAASFAGVSQAPEAAPPGLVISVRTNSLGAGARQRSESAESSWPIDGRHGVAQWRGVRHAPRVAGGTSSGSRARSGGGARAASSGDATSVAGVSQAPAGLVLSVRTTSLGAGAGQRSDAAETGVAKWRGVLHTPKSTWVVATAGSTVFDGAYSLKSGA